MLKFTTKESGVVFNISFMIDVKVNPFVLSKIDKIGTYSVLGAYPNPDDLNFAIVEASDYDTHVVVKGVSVTIEECVQKLLNSIRLKESITKALNADLNDPDFLQVCIEDLAKLSTKFDTISRRSREDYMEIDPLTLSKLRKTKETLSEMSRLFTPLPRIDLRSHHTHLTDGIEYSSERLLEELDKYKPIEPIKPRKNARF